ncbi:hypothetical protein NXV89_15710 [Bacteroides uniformis]|nr:hypothetical protein [Bacteroides uniformis]
MLADIAVRCRCGHRRVLGPRSSPPLTWPKDSRYPQKRRPTPFGRILTFSRGTTYLVGKGLQESLWNHLLRRIEPDTWTAPADPGCLAKTRPTRSGADGTNFR